MALLALCVSNHKQPFYLGDQHRGPALVFAILSSHHVSLLLVQAASVVAWRCYLYSSPPCPRYGMRDVLCRGLALFIIVTLLYICARSILLQA